MTILCIETSTSVCSAAICRDGAVLRQYIQHEGSNHAQLLPRFIEQLLRESREQHWTIEAVALSEGPGSYTGLRIGTATAKGLCYGLNVPLIPVPTLEVLCEAAKESTEYRVQNTEYKVQSTDLLCPMIDARRMEVYTLAADGKARAVVVENEESFNLQPSAFNVYYFGDGAAKCQHVLTAPNWHFIPDIVPEAQFMGRLAESGEREAVSGERIAYYEPYYLKEFIAAPSHVKGLQ